MQELNVGSIEKKISKTKEGIKRVNLFARCIEEAKDKEAIYIESNSYQCKFFGDRLEKITALLSKFEEEDRVALRSDIDSVEAISKLFKAKE